MSVYREPGRVLSSLEELELAAARERRAAEDSAAEHRRRMEQAIMRARQLGAREKARRLIDEIKRIYGP